MGTLLLCALGCAITAVCPPFGLVMLLLLGMGGKH